MSPELFERPVSATVTLRYADGTVVEVDIPEGNYIKAAFEAESRDYDLEEFRPYARRAEPEHIKVTLDTEPAGSSALFKLTETKGTP